jgi:subtilisin-like proprotein convertase family protein
MHNPLARRAIFGRSLTLVLFLLGVTACATGKAPTTPTVTQTMGIVVPATGPATPYPSTVTVADLPGTIQKVTVTLTGLTHTHTNDLDVLLVGPSGASTVLVSDAGGADGVTNVTLTFDDASPTSLGTWTIVSGTFKPTNYGAGDVMPLPAPAGPHGATLAAFAGTNPNGVWSLYVVDDAAGDAGTIDGWSLTITSF